MNGRRSEPRVVAVLTALWLGVALAGQDDCALAMDLYRVEITPVLHQGDPAPGVAGALAGLFLPPQIDAAGNLLVETWMTGDGITQDNNYIIYYGPPGGLTRVVREGDQAPDLPAGVVFAQNQGTGITGYVSENGLVAVSSYLAGPGVIPDVNDEAVFYGPPNELHLAVRLGDPAPDTEPGTVFKHVVGFGAYLNDVGGMLLGSGMSGPSVNSTNDRGLWTGLPGDLHLVWREGMQAPGTEPGVVFEWGDLIHFNESGWVSLRCGLTGPGIGGENDTGRWVGPAGQLALLAREGDAVPGFPAGVTYKIVGSIPRINAAGDVGVAVLMQGPGIDETNDNALFVGGPGLLQLVAREGDPAPEAGPGVMIAGVDTPTVNARRELLYRADYAGPGINETNRWAVYYGPYGQARLEMRDGEPAPGLDSDLLLARVVSLPVTVAMNDVGDAIGRSEVAGVGVTPENRTVLWQRDAKRARWFPLLRSGTPVATRTVIFDTGGQVYWHGTGGGDGQPQSFNDAAQAALVLEFMDGTEGLYLAAAQALGDLDADADVDLADFARFQGCYSGAGVSVTPECESSDLDEDDDVDLADFEILAGNYTGPL